MSTSYHRGDRVRLGRSSLGITWPFTTYEVLQVLTYGPTLILGAPGGLVRHARESEVEFVPCPGEEDHGGEDPGVRPGSWAPSWGRAPRRCECGGRLPSRSIGERLAEAMGDPNALYWMLQHFRDPNGYAARIRLSALICQACDGDAEDCEHCHGTGWEPERDETSEDKWPSADQ